VHCGLWVTAVKDRVDERTNERRTLSSFVRSFVRSFVVVVVVVGGGRWSVVGGRRCVVCGVWCVVCGLFFSSRCPVDWLVHSLVGWLVRGGGGGGGCLLALSFVRCPIVLLFVVVLSFVGCCLLLLSLSCVVVVPMLRPRGNCSPTPRAIILCFVVLVVLKLLVGWLTLYHILNESTSSQLLTKGKTAPVCDCCIPAKLTQLLCRPVPPAARVRACCLALSAIVSVSLLRRRLRPAKFNHVNELDKATEVQRP